jgi:hypothetical protein
MPRIRIAFPAVLAAMILSATAATAASAERLTLSEGGLALAPGRTFEAYGFENIRLNTSLGDVECVGVSAIQPTFGVKVEVLNNSQKVDSLRVLGQIRGTAASGACRGGALGHAALTAVALGTLKVRAFGKATEGPVVFKVHWERGQGPEGTECYFEKEEPLKGTNNATLGPEPLVIQFPQQPLKRSHLFVGSQECPRSATISLSFSSTFNEEEESNLIDEQL